VIPDLKLDSHYSAHLPDNSLKAANICSRQCERPQTNRAARAFNLKAQNKFFISTFLGIPLAQQFNSTAFGVSRVSYTQPESHLSYRTLLGLPSGIE
jgi:hypothetical protein